MMANALNSRMCVEDNSTATTALVHNNDVRLRKILRSYPETVNYLLKKFATDEATAEFEAAILRYKKQSNMTPHKYVEGLVAKSCKIVWDNESYKINQVSV